MNGIGNYQAFSYKRGNIGLLRTAKQRESKMPEQRIGFLNPAADDKESDEKKISGSGVIKAETSVQQGEWEQALLSERIQNQMSEAPTGDKDLEKRKWEYVHRFPAWNWSEAYEKKVFSNKQICLDGDGSSVLTDKQIALLREKYDMNHLSAEDTYYFLCDLTEMNVFSSEEWAAALIGNITILPEDMNKLSISSEGKWNWVEDENGNFIIVETKVDRWKEEEEEEDPALIKARIKGITDDILLAAFCPEDKKDISSSEDLQAKQSLKENADGITSELEAMLQSGMPIIQGGANSGINSDVLIDIAVHKHNYGLEIKGIRQAAYQAPEAAARLLPQYQKAYDACDKLLRIVDQVRR